MGNSTSPGDGIFHWEANEPYHKSFWIPQREQGISSEMHKPVYAVSQEKAERESYLLPNTLFPAGKWLHMEGTTCRSHLALVQWEEKKNVYQMLTKTGHCILCQPTWNSHFIYFDQNASFVLKVYSTSNSSEKLTSGNAYCQFIPQVSFHQPLAVCFIRKESITYKFM